MAYTTIKKPSDYFNTNLWTGNGGTQSITGVGFQPDWSVIKRRNAASGSQCIDAVRGVIKKIAWNESSQGNDVTNGITSFDSDGYTLGDSAAFNGSGDSHVGWSWKANGAGSANTDGSISSTVSANTTSGFSIVKYNSTRTPSAVQTVGHGLGVSPDVLIFKNLNETQNWLVWHKDIATNQHLNLNTTSALSTDAGSLNNTAPTSSVFTIGGDGRTNSATEGNPIVCYAFAEKQGFSKFGSYTGNGNADGTFVYTGFKPAFIIQKNASTGSTNWQIFDNKRNDFNVVDDYLIANSSGAEGVSTSLDFVSNGFKIRQSAGYINTSGDTYIYMAFAEEPLVGDNPATAR
jgi:hypothetical protein